MDIDSSRISATIISVYDFCVIYSERIVCDSRDSKVNNKPKTAVKGSAFFFAREIMAFYIIEGWLLQHI